MTIQKHSGPGDNVAGDKIENIIRSIQSGDLHTVLAQIFDDICCRDFSSACKKIGALIEVRSLEPDVAVLLRALNMKASIAAGRDFDHSEIVRCREGLLKALNQEKYSGVESYAQSILIELEVRLDRNQAQNRVEEVGLDDPCIREVYFEHLASSEEIFLDRNTNLMCKNELAGLIRGAIRLGEFQRAMELSSKSMALFNDNNSEALIFLSRTLCLNSDLTALHYYLMPLHLKKIFDELIECVSVDRCRGDRRYLHGLVILLHVSSFLEQGVVGVGRECVDLIRNIDERCASILEGIYNVEDNISFDIPKSLDIDTLGVLFLNVGKGVVSISDLKGWISNGGSFDIENSYLKQFSQLYLNALVFPENDQVKLNVLKTDAEGFFRSEEGSLRDINPVLIMSFCERLMVVGLKELACDFMGKLISGGVWCSPWYMYYINCLYESEQYGELTRQLSGISDRDKSYWLLTKEADFREKFCDYERVVLCARLAIEIDPDTPYAWCSLFRGLRLGGVEVSEIKGELKRIPDRIFQDFDRSKIPLVYEIFCHVDAFFAETVLIDWFVLNPDELAIPLTQIHLESIMRGSGSEDGNPYKARYCRDGVIYTDGFNEFKHILVEGLQPRSQEFISVESPRGKLLVSMNVGDTICDPRLGDITLTERIPPSVAVFRLAADIRHKSNDGSDPFNIFSVPENKDEFLPYFEKVIKRFSVKEELSDDVLKFPLTMRGKYLFGGSPVRAAISQLCSGDRVSALGLYSDGIRVSSEVEVVIDVYTSVYLSLLGMPSWLKLKGFNVVVTKETAAAINDWLADVTSDDYLFVGMRDGRIVRETSEDMKRDNADFLRGLETIIEMSTVKSLEYADFPHELMQIRQFVDESVYSTLQLCYANSIPLLCIDHNLCYLYGVLGFSIGNMRGVVEDFLTGVSKEVVRRCIALSLFQGIPLPIFYRDIVGLVLSGDIDELILVEKFLQKYGAPTSEDEAVKFRAVVALSVIRSYCVESSRYPLVNHIYQSIFNLCARDALHNGSERTTEGRFASFLFAVFSECGDVKILIRQVDSFACAFAQGHFLDVETVKNHLDRLFDRLHEIEVQ